MNIGDKIIEKDENSLNMNKFYDSIAEKYDFIFPLTDIQKSFMDIEIKGKKILDIGAATGKIGKYLMEKGFDVVSIDINENLIKKAEKKGITVINKNMLDIDSMEEFDTIINIGNTLPHLKDKKEVCSFLLKAYNQLNKGGRLILQIVNFIKFTSPIMEKKVLEEIFLGNLPLIENHNVKFERAYYLNNERNILFKTLLDDEIKNSEVLLNIDYREIIGYMEEMGYRDISMYGGFDKSKFIPEKSIFLVITGDKK